MTTSTRLHPAASLISYGNFSVEWTAQFFTGKTFVAECDVTYWLNIVNNDPYEIELEQVEIDNTIITEKSDPVMFGLFKADVARNHARFVEIAGERQ